MGKKWYQSFSLLEIDCMAATFSLFFFMWGRIFALVGLYCFVLCQSLWFADSVSLLVGMWCLPVELPLNYAPNLFFLIINYAPNWFREQQRKVIKHPRRPNTTIQNAFPSLDAFSMTHLKNKKATLNFRGF